MSAASTSFVRGQFVRMTYGETTIDAMVLLASTNGKSLMLGFSGALGGDFVFIESMPVLMDESGTYRDLIMGLPVTIEPKRRADAQ